MHLSVAARLLARRASAKAKTYTLDQSMLMAVNANGSGRFKELGSLFGELEGFATGVSSSERKLAKMAPRTCKLFPGPRILS
jgi:hypothetical protein